MKVIFLDIDGVLNHEGTYAANARRGPTAPAGWLDPACLARLDALCERTRSQLVVSSSWRIYLREHVGGVAGVLAEAGLRAPVIDETPDLTVDRGGIVVSKGRGAEIATWLAARRDVRCWCVLDDCDVQVDPARFVKTSITTGLTIADCDRAAAILGAA